jgi:hypothetical protein
MGSALRLKAIAKHGPRTLPEYDPSRPILVIRLIGLGLITLTLLVAGFAAWDMRNRDVEAYRREIAT